MIKTTTPISFLPKISLRPKMKGEIKPQDKYMHLWVRKDFLNRT